jgi:endonuclease III
VARRHHIPLIEHRLREAFGIPVPPEPPGERDVVEELVLTVLSQHTSSPNADRALLALRERFPTWNAVAEASPEEIAACIRTAGLANQKAPRIRGMLRYIHDQRGEIELEFLSSLPLAEAMAWLRAMPGVGQTTAACVLLFGLGRPAMPVDTGIARVAGRLGFVRPGALPEETAATLEDSAPADRIYSLHVNLIRHAREICRPREPLCEVCPVNDVCDYFAREGTWR